MDVMCLVEMTQKLKAESEELLNPISSENCSEHVVEMLQTKDMVERWDGRMNDNLQYGLSESRRMRLVPVVHRELRYRRGPDIWTTSYTTCAGLPIPP